MQFVLLVDDEGKCSYLVGDDATEWENAVDGNELIAKVHGVQPHDFKWRDATVEQMVELISSRNAFPMSKLTAKDRVKTGIVYSAVFLIISIFLGVIILPWLSFDQYGPTTNTILLCMLISILVGYIIGLFRPIKFEE